MLPASRPHLLRPASSLDVAIVGCGAAGIAAARACLAAGLSVGVFEARDRVGGRALTASFGGHPVDLGAHWLHAGRLNPLVRLGRERGEPIRRAPTGGALVENGRFARRAEREAHGEAFDRVDRAFARAARAPADSSLAAAFPPLGRWRRPAMATFALVSGRPLAEVSVKDFPSDEFGDNYFVRGGYGSYLARLACGLPVALGAAVQRIDWSGAGVAIETAEGRAEARAAIVTVPMPVLAAAVVRFVPELPAPLASAIAAFLPGTYEHVVLNWPESPFRRPDRLAKLVSDRASYGMMTRIDDAPFHYLELDYATADGRTPAQRARLARAFLAGQFGASALHRIRVLAVTDWAADPWSRCAWAVAAPGHWGERDLLGHPVGGADLVRRRGQHAGDVGHGRGCVGVRRGGGRRRRGSTSAVTDRDFVLDGGPGVFSPTRG